MSAGFYVGDDANAPFFYAYIYPEPPGCAEIALGVDGATWSTQLREWVLPYDAMRAAAHPEQRLAAFLDAIYGVCCAAGGWDRERYVYAPPPLRHAPPT
ncbi:MAG: hypothetical protein JOZ24_01815, partial [Candidatus Eremiobacteraeota bacterium]|nr:hypothetical protein [Candidatus Eremiobacteraeota bacterium]